MILLGPKRAKRGRVCRDCAALGWLFVLGSDLGSTKKKSATVLEKVGFQLRERPRSKAPAKALAATVRGDTPDTDDPRLPVSLSMVTLSKGQRKVLIAVVQHGGLERGALALLTGYRKSSRDLYLQQLARLGLVSTIEGIVTPAAYAATFLGDFERIPTRGRALRDHWLSILKGGERRMLEHLTHNPIAVVVERDDLGDALGYRKSSRDLYIQKLARRRLVTVSPQGVRAAAELF